MNHKQGSKFNMCMGLEDFLMQNSATVSTLPNVVDNLAEFQSIIALIHKANEQQSHRHDGVASNKHELKEDLVLMLEDLTRKITSYAGITGNTILMGEVDVAKSIMEKMADTALLGYAQSVNHVMLPILPVLAPYGVTPPDHLNLTTAINAYEAVIPSTRASIAERKQATDDLKVLFERIDKVLEKIDFAMDIIKVSNASFYGLYKSRRKVVAVGVGGAIAINGTVTEVGTGVLLGAVKISIAGGTQPIQDRWTTTLGNFQVDNLPEGTYQVTANRPGYRVLTKDVYVAKNTTMIVKIELSPV